MISNFLFHRVNPVREKLWGPMDVALFDKCIKYITTNYEIQLLEDLIEQPRQHVKNKIATIVFDDGFKDNLEYAAPILEKYNCKASFYVVTNCIDHNIPTWTYILEYRFLHTSVKNLDLDFDFLPETLKVKELQSTEARIVYVQKLKPFLKQLSHEQRNQVLNAIDKTYNDVELPHIMMNWNDLLELKNAGHYIGSHTMSHCMLGTMSDKNQISLELKQSANTIENKLGHFPKTISYPVGSYNDQTIEICQEAGYKAGLAVKQTTYNPEKNSIFEIPRIELYNEPWWKTRMRITSMLENIKTTIGYK